MSFPSRTVIIDYTNYQGVRGRHKIEPFGIIWGKTDYHTEPQWLLNAYNVDKQAYRTYALSGVHEWQPAESKS